MKKLILIALVLLNSALCYSQDKMMTSVLGVELGSTRAQVKSKMAEKFAKIYNETEVSISYENIKFGAYKPLLVMFQFTEDEKLHTCHVFVDADDCKEIFGKYDEIVKDINSKYFTTSKMLEDYKYPYEKKDKYDHTETIVKKGYVTMLSLWTFDVRNTPENSEDDNAISVSVEKSCSVKVTYQEGLLIRQAIAKDKVKNSEDY